MGSGFVTPLLELFKRGEAAQDVKMLAAQGALAPRAHEQLGLLALLVQDSDAEIAGTAEKTLQTIPKDAIAAFLARTDAPTCPECGSIMIPNGSCHKCVNCGTASGCS